MQNPALDVVLRKAAPFEEAVDKFAHFLADHFRNVFRKKNVEAGIAKVEAHRAERIGERVSFRRQNFRATIRFAGDNDGGSAIAKKNRRD